MGPGIQLLERSAEVMVMDGFDLDGTLAAVDFASTGATATVFANAPVLYVPSAAFAVVTGRPHAAAAQRDATAAWLRQHQPQCQGIHYIDAGSAAVTAQRKAAVINRLGLGTYTDNNPDVLAELASLTKARLWQMRDGKRLPFVDRAALARTWAPTLHR